MDLATRLLEYRELERTALQYLPPRYIQFSGSEVFSDNSFPRANLVDETLAYYLDSQQENRGHVYMSLIGSIPDSLVPGLNLALDILDKANDKVVYEKASVSALLHGLYCAVRFDAQFRVKSGGSTGDVIEVAAGSGWTSFFLLCLGYGVSVIDTTPVFVVTQDYLLAQAADHSGAKFRRVQWWDFYAYETQFDQSFDALIINHAICEFSDWARLYIAKWAQVNVNAGIGHIFVQAWGDERFCSREKTVNLFKSHHWDVSSAYRAREIGEIYILGQLGETKRPLAYRILTKLGLNRIAEMRFLPSTVYRVAEAEVSLSEMLQDRYGAALKTHCSAFRYAGINH